MSYRIVIVGATGAVGQAFLEVLERSSLPVAGLKPLASARSAGQTITFKGETLTLEEARPAAFEGVDVAFFSAGASVSQALAPEAVQRGCTVIDNSSAFRMEPGVPLVVPEVNAEAALGHKGLIANPNCSTIITLMGLAPLHRHFGLRCLIAATYQAVSGSGVAGMRELEAQVAAHTQGTAPTCETYPHPIAFNVLPQVDRFFEDGYTKEEHKMRNESRKILSLPELRVSTTCVRVPVFRAHSVAVHAAFDQAPDLAAARAAIEAAPGVELLDDPASQRYPLPLDAAGKDPCGVGRMRLDSALENGLALWVVGDQILKGAALNAVQIAEALHARDALRLDHATPSCM